jgi:hypothetical protein
MTDSASLRRLAGVALAAALALVAGCTSTPDGPDDPDIFDPVPAGALRLVAFDSCADALAGLQRAASRSVGPWGFVGGGGDVMLSAEDGAARTGADGAPQAAGADAAQGAPAAPPVPAPGGEPAHSGTNTHEAGVDEPDLVKTDGRRIITVAGGVLRVVDAASRTVTGTVDLRRDAEDPIRWQATDLLLHGDHALLLVRDGWYWAGPVGPATDIGRPAPRPGELAGPRLLLVDLTGGPRVLSEYTVDGSLVDARQVGSAVRVVVRSMPRLEFPYQEEGTDADRLRANREIVNSTGIADWLPRFRVTTGGTTNEGQVDCADLTRPAQYSGTSMLTVLSFDLAASALGDGDPLTVVADGETVYGTGTSLYVATDQRWQAMPVPLILPDGDEPAPRSMPQPRTEIYKFDLAQPGRPRYAASGAVDGWLLNQYSMSEWEGHLRVATTTGDPWGGAATQQSESTVYVLAQRGEALARVGSVGGLGSGEQIYSVRFVGPVGYVVTFRQTDPLYTLDLSDPTAPEVIGELKITGYSAYLHPLDAGRLLGIGQEADERGVVQGTQVSLFDVSELADPTRLAQHHIRHGNSEAEFDPHAFLWWPAQRLLVVPLTVYDWERGDQPEAGTLLLRVGDASISEVATISHPRTEQDGYEYYPQIRRSLVVGDTLWTVSDAGLLATSLSTLNDLEWIPFS